MAALDGERDSAGFNFGRAILGASGGAPALAVPDLAGHGAQGEPQPQQDQQDQQEAPPPPPPRLRVAPPEAPVAVELLPNSLSLQWSQCSVTVQARELRVVNYVLLYELSMQQVGWLAVCSPVSALLPPPRSASTPSMTRNRVLLMLCRSRATAAQPQKQWSSRTGGACRCAAVLLPALVPPAPAAAALHEQLR